MHHIIALVGLAGSGKTECSKIFEEFGYIRIRFGDVTMEKLKEAKLAVSEKNERMVREQLRKQYGMQAYATLNIQKIRAALNRGNVVIDGLYSWSEYKVLLEEFKQAFITVAVYTEPTIRYKRLITRSERSLTKEQARSRDVAEIENIEKAGPIAIADHTILNNTTLDDLKGSLKTLIQMQ